MQIGIVGLGRMGANIARRLSAAGHECVIFDVDQEAVGALADERIRGAHDLADLAAQLSAPRAVWAMVPAGITGQVLSDIAEHLEAGDILIDGGNSYYRDDLTRSASLGELGLHFVDVGTSGGVFGLDRGYCLMIGGEPEVVGALDPVFASLAPGFTAAPRTTSRTGAPAPSERGYLHCGPAGAGHFVKMVHNGIEYGLMAAIAEGLAILDQADIGEGSAAPDAENAPLRDPDGYRYHLDLAEITELWRRGSVVSSWLLDLAADALHKDPDLSGLSGRVSDSGEGRWTALAAIDEGVPAPVLTAALFSRFSSRGGDDLSNRVLSAMRREFGGHQEQKGDNR
ncbi:MAG: phosphogluconate dehydrogenase (NAD(+)-dependent, decarboxylating) [Actinomycetes bacterium]